LWSRVGTAFADLSVLRWRPTVPEGDREFRAYLTPDREDAEAFEWALS
jgi:hypothetical protein